MIWFILTAVSTLLIVACSRDDNEWDEPDCVTDEDCVGRGEATGESSDFHDPSKVTCRKWPDESGSPGCRECVEDDECPQGYFCDGHQFCLEIYVPNANSGDTKHDAGADTSD